MEPGYEMEPAPIGRSTDRKVPATLITIAILLAVVVAKPWAGTSEVPVVAPIAERAAPSTSMAAIALAADPSPFGARRPPAPTEPPAPGWPAAAGEFLAVGASPSEAEQAIVALAAHAETWGVGIAGVGPRLVRDEPWADWTTVVPEFMGDMPEHILMWPGTSLCRGLPAINDRGSIVAIGAPASFSGGVRVVGWYTDGARSASLDGSVRQVLPEGGGTARYLERIDRGPWPAGRYEFHLVADEGIVGLTVCLAPFD